MNICYDIILKYTKGKDVLDIGSCAEQGKNIKPKTLYNLIKKNSNSVVGIDIESGTPEIIKANAETVKINKKFDLIVAGDVIEHLHNPGIFLDNMYQHLKNEGKMIIVTPNVKSIGYLPFKGNDYHTCWYCKNTLRYLVENHNFKVEKVIFGLRKKKNVINNFFRNIFANNIMFVCKKI